MAIPVVEGEPDRIVHGDARADLLRFLAGYYFRHVSEGVLESHVLLELFIFGLLVGDHEVAALVQPDVHAELV